MWWNALAGGIAGYFHNDSINAEIDSANRISASNAKAGNIVRQAQNALKAAQGGLARWVQSVNNNRRLDAGAGALEANIVNYRRGRDALGREEFGQSIRRAEVAGGAAAQQAFAGVTGSVVDMVNGSTALRDSIVREDLKQRGEFLDFDAAHRAGTIMHQTVQGLDGSVILDSLDYNVEVAKSSPLLSKFRTALTGAFAGAGLGDAFAGEKDARGKQEGGFKADYGGNSGESRAGENYGNEGRNYKFEFKTQDETPAYGLWGRESRGASADTADYTSDIYFG